MFRQVEGKYEIECDGCGKVNYTGQRSFHQARNVSSVENWEHRQLRGTWINYCPNCVENERVVAVGETSDRNHQENGRHDPHPLGD